MKLFFKCVCLLSIVAILAHTTPVLTFANTEVSVTLDGEQITFTDQGPVIIDDRTLVPVGDVFAAMGFTPSWDSNARQATLTRGTDVVVITIGSYVFTTNGTSHNLDVPAQIIANRTLLPLRAVLESLGYTLYWDSNTRTAVITSPEVDELTGEQREVTYDMIRFREEYTSLNGQPNAAGRIMKTIEIPEMNLISYITPEQILSIAESGTGLIYFGFPQCPWCRQMTPLLIDVALYLGLDYIYYIDMLPIRTTWALQDGVPVMTDPGHDYYQDLLQVFSEILEPMELNPFHLADSDGNMINTEELRIFVPTVVAIRDGEIVDFHIYTVDRSASGNAGGYQWYPLSDEEELYLREIYIRVISAIME